MSVIIPIGANASSAVAAFDDVREAIRRAGQEGKSFKDLDLSHPELAGFAQDLGRMRQQLEDLLRIGQGDTARATRHVVNNTGWDPLWSARDRDYAWETLYADPAQRARYQARVEAHITRGTMFAPGAVPPSATPGVGPPPPPPPPPRRRASTSDDDDEKGGSGLFSSALGMVKRGGLFALGMAGINGVGNTIHKAYSGAVEEDTHNDRLFRQMPGLAADFDKLRDSVRQAADGMGITYQEAQRLAGSFMRITGTSQDRDGTDVMQSWVRLSAGFGRGWGIDAQSATSAFARAGQSDLQGDKFAALVGDAAAQGMQTGNMQRVMESILRYQETTQRILVNAGTGNAERFAGMWAGMNASGLPGMRGDNATALIGTMDEALRSGGRGGHASEAVTYRAFAANGVSDPYEMAYDQEGGMFAALPNGKTLYEAVRGEIDRQYGGLPAHQRQMAVARHFGITMHQAEALDSIHPADVTRTSGTLAGYGIDAAKIDPTAFAEIAKALASDQGLVEARSALLKRSDLSADEKTSLNAASGDKLREMVVRTMAVHGMTQTEGSRQIDATVNLTNELTKQGTRIVEPLTAMKELLARIIGGVDTIARFFTSGPAAGTGALPFMGGDVPAGGIMTIAAMMSGRGGAGPGLMNASFSSPAGAWSFGGGAPATGAGSVAMADRAGILARATAGTAISPELLDALITQESGWRPGLQRPGGTDLGLGQITDTTAARPGYGMDPISRADRMDPEKSARWAALYLYRKARAAGISDADLHTPAGMAKALRLYNGGGDAHYAEHVFSHMHLPPSVNHHAPVDRHDNGPFELQASIEPLRVIHEDRRGNVLRDESLQVRQIRSPMAYGVA